MTSDRVSSKLAASLQAFSGFLQHIEKPISSPEHLCNGSLWFDILLDVGFKPKVSGSDLSIGGSRTREAQRRLNLTSLYYQLMLYLDKNLSKPTVNFCVPDLDVLAKQEINPSTAQAIVHMNALVLTAYTHSSAGLKQFRKLDQVYEDTLSEDMAKVGGGRWEKSAVLKNLRNETAKIKVDLEEANTELNAMKEFHQGHDMQHEQQKSQWEDQVNELHKEIDENNETMYVSPLTMITLLMLEQDQEKLQRRNKELDDAYRVTGLMLAKAEDLGRQLAESLGNAETQLNERQAVKPHQDHGQVLQDEEDIMVINFSDEALQQLQTADEDLHAKFANLEQEQHQTLKANKILEVEVAKKQETVMNLAEQVKKLTAELERAYQDIKHQNGLQEQQNNEIEELQSQLVTGPKAPSFAEESAIAKMQKDLDILEEQLAMTIHDKNDKTRYAEPGTVSIGHAVLQRRLADSYHQLHQLQQKHDELQNRWDIQKLVLLLSSREQERHKTYQELEGQNAQVQAQNQQIQSNLNDQTSQLHELQQKHNELQNKWDVQRSVLSLSSREQESHKAYQELEGQNAQVQAQNQQIQSNLSDQTSQLHELQQKHNELQNKWDVQRSVLSLSSREQESHKAYQELEGRNARMEAQNQQIQINLNDQTIELHELQQKNNEVQKRWDVQRLVLSLSSREQERHKAYEVLESRNAQIEATIQQIQSNLNETQTEHSGDQLKLDVHNYESERAKLQDKVVLLEQKLSNSRDALKRAQIQHKIDEVQKFCLLSFGETLTQKK
ncbi:hypothetical protein DFH08DRAFT_827091 [Mycena albidolilacea]|uniref:Uncharacterized protein n=1 Tax=Mycena albidolilacea TaxID=1033008 RepID=A0AAD6YYZ7_9AGAR|nr:hypothetical protein DFH08DRAFT_827091 [Mycena albidolilacea]